ncbi:MAG: lysylphosphatidylglycerol synthase transmembrane domain-containing protein [Phototrophicaceae bacterium]|jgi:uncharacterized protein (TIRG00374 family)
MWKRIVAILASIAVSAVFLWLAVRDIPLADIWQSLLQANPWWALAALVVGCLGIYTRGIRWRGLVNFQVTRARAFYIMGITFILNLLPLRIGEAARAVLATREKIPLMTAATSIIVERLLDVITVLIVLAVCFTQVETLPDAVRQSVLVFSVLAIIAFVVLIVLARFPDFSKRTLHAIVERIPLLERLPLESLLVNVLDGLRPLVVWGSFVHAVVWTLISWALSLTMFYLTQLALGYGADSLLNAALSLTLASFSVAVPLSVGAIGPFQGAVRLAGEALNVPGSLSTAMGFLVHGLTIAMYAITGIWGFLATGVSLADLTQRDEAAG